MDETESRPHVVARWADHPRGDWTDYAQQIVPGLTLAEAIARDLRTLGYRVEVSPAA